MCGVRVQQICKTFSSEIVVHENIDPQKFSTVQYMTVGASL